MPEFASPPPYDLVPQLCVTCARPPPSDKEFKDLFPLPPQPCDEHYICPRCLTNNPRFQTYCPLCPATPRLPPAYSPPATPQPGEYSESATSIPPPSSSTDPEKLTTVLHYLTPTDTIASVSLAYHIPPDVIRRHNRIFDDFLLAGRETIEIPGVKESLRPTVEDKEKWERDKKRRRVMMETRCGWEEAEVYLNLEGGVVEDAVRRWKADKEWEDRRRKQEERDGKGKGKGKGTAQDRWRLV